MILQRENIGLELKMSESQKVESVDGVYTFNVENVSPGTTIKV